MMNMRQRTRLPTLATRGEKTQKGDKEDKLKPLVVGTQVLIQDPKSKKWDSEGIVVDIRPNGRSYYIKTESKGLMLRNRKFIDPK